MFLKYFLISLGVGTAVLVTAAHFLLPSLGINRNDEGEATVFAPPTVNLRDEMPVLVDKDSPYFSAFKDAKRINILLLGLNENLTDTIMLASFNYDTKKIDLISIPRDTYYYRAQYAGSASFLKVNAVYEATKNPLGTAEVVSTLLKGMPIHCYMKVDYEGVKRIVDAMGGVPMDVTFPMKYKDPSARPPLIIDIPKGYQVLDGEHAVQFLRYRKGTGGGYREGDIGRVKAQQRFMQSAFHQMIGFDLPKIAQVIFKNVESDITLNQALKLATQAIGMKGADIKTYIMPHTLQDEPPYYVYPNDAGIGKMIDEIYTVFTPSEAGGGDQPAGQTDKNSQKTQ